MKILKYGAGVSALLVVAFLIALIFHSSRGSVTVVNKSKEPIILGSIEVCGQQFAFRDVPPSENITRQFAVLADSEYQLSVTFQSGKQLSRKIGYVTSGTGYKDTIAITETDMVLEDARMK